MGIEKIVTGTPTDPDIDRLRKAYPAESLVEGREISYDELEAVINLEGDCTKDSLRFRTVTWRWRRQMEINFHIRLGAVPGVGLRVLTPGERVVESECHTTRAFRQAKKAHYRASIIDRNRLEPEQAKRAEHVQLCSAAILSHGRLIASSKSKPNE